MYSLRGFSVLEPASNIVDDVDEDELGVSVTGACSCTDSLTWSSEAGTSAFSSNASFVEFERSFSLRLSRPSEENNFSNGIKNSAIDSSKAKTKRTDSRAESEKLELAHVE